MTHPHALTPARFDAGEGRPGLKPGVGIMFVGWFARFSFLPGLPIVGALADVLPRCST